MTKIINRKENENYLIHTITYKWKTPFNIKPVTNCDYKFSLRLSNNNIVSILLEGKNDKGTKNQISAAFLQAVIYYILGETSDIIMTLHNGKISISNNDIIEKYSNLLNSYICDIQKIAPSSILTYLNSIEYGNQIINEVLKDIDAGNIRCYSTPRSKKELIDCIKGESNESIKRSVSYIKELANSELYFNMFRNSLKSIHGNILLSFLSNEEVIKRIIDRLCGNDNINSITIIDNYYIIESIKSSFVDEIKSNKIVCHIINEDSRSCLDDFIKIIKGQMFDICLMNPPYGKKSSGTSEHYHLKFVEKCLEISENLISIFPNRLIKSTSTSYNDYKKKFDKRLVSVKEIDSSVFQQTSMENVAIFTFSNKSTNTIKITNIDGNTKEIKSLLDTSNPFSDYELNIVKFLENKNISKMRAHLQNPGKKEKNDKELLLKKCQNLLTKFKDKPIYLTTNIANSKKNGTFMSSSLGKIFNNPNDLWKDWISRNGKGMIVLAFRTKKEAENCRIALQNPLLRFCLYRLQDNQNMHSRVYKYIPDIDWENPMTTTDEGLLEICGYPKDKIEEYSEYCKRIIEEIDKK